jgi:hypothetical protein
MKTKDMSHVIKPNDRHFESDKNHFKNTEMKHQSWQKNIWLTHIQNIEHIPSIKIACAYLQKDTEMK